MGLKISIIVLTLNSEKYIRRCLKSIEFQTFSDFEVIIVDAGSTDKTKKIAAEFDSRFRFLELPKSDMGMARNFGIQNSKGEYITFLDSDDFYLPEKLFLQKQYLDNNIAVDVFYCAAIHYRTGNYRLIGIKKDANQPKTLHDFLSGLNYNLNTMFIRRKIWERGFRFGEGAKGRYGEEWRLQLSLSIANVNMHYKGIPLVITELRPDSHTLWSIQWKMKEMAVREVEEKLMIIREGKKDNDYGSDILDRFRYKLIVAYVLEGKIKDAQREKSMVRNTELISKLDKIINIGKIVPNTLLRKAMIFFWLKKQNNSFVWSKTAENVLTYIQELNKKED